MGCGSRKFNDCMGIDKVAYRGVDLVHDFEKPLPLKDNSVQFVMASHSLEYAENLLDVLGELYRVCRHKAMVCLVVPYAHVSSHLVNPQFKQLFNEYSPRYWTASADHVISEDEFMLPQQESWSLNEDSSIDFRPLHMEYFYFPAYCSGYDRLELSLLRQSQLNVVHQMMIHLLVVKQPISLHEMQLLQETATFEEPTYITEHRAAITEIEAKETTFYLDHLHPILGQMKGKKSAAKPSTKPSAWPNSQKEREKGKEKVNEKDTEKGIAKREKPLAGKLKPASRQSTKTKLKSAAEKTRTNRI